MQSRVFAARQHHDTFTRGVEARTGDAGHLPAAGRHRSLPPALETITGYAAEQRLIPRRFTVDELFDDTTRKMI
jgi:hypothetical protein